MGFSFPKWVSSLRRPTHRPIRRIDRLPGGPLGVTPLEDRTMPTVLGTYALLEGPSAGTDANLVVTAGGWTASSSASWLHTSATGSGNGSASFTYDANTGPTRTGTVTIDGQSLSVTQAGAGYVTPNPTGLPAINANLYGARGSVVDPAGNVYFADTGHNQVTVYHPTNGQVTTLPAAGLIYPAGLSLDAAGNVYIADAGDNAIKKYDATAGTTTTLTTSYNVNATGAFNDPEGVAVDAAGKVYFTDFAGNRFGVYNPADGTTTQLLDGNTLYRPNQLATDAAGDVYISDDGNNRILKYDPPTATFSVLVSGGYNRSGGLGVDGRGNVYFSDRGNGALKVYNPQTAAVATLVTGLNNPTGVAVTPAGDVSVLETNTQNFKILPQAYLVADPQSPAAAAGTLSIPVAALSPLALSGAMLPTSDQSWLTVTDVSGGQLNLSYTANTGTAARSANVSLLGRTVAVTQAAAALPVIDSPTATAVSSAGATLGGRLVSAGTAAVTRRGVLYAPAATNENPQLNDTGVVELDDASTANGTFTKTAAGLSPSTVYTYRAFATNANGTAYTSVTTFTTLPTVQFATASESVNEYEGTFSVTVSLSGVAASDVTVPFTLGGTAVNGTDYSDVSAGPLVIPAGQTSATVTGTLIDNGYETTNRTIVFTLGGPANADLGTTPTDTLTIVSDSPPAVNFATGGETVNATTGSFTVIVSLSRASNVDTTVPFTLGGTAVNGTDYSNVSASPLVIPAGQTSAAITGTLLVNAAAASDPTLTFTLGTPTHAVPGDTPPYVLTIHEPTNRPTVVDVGGLEFQTAAGFDATSNAYAAGGTVQVGLVPASGQPFVALLTLQGGTTINTAAQTVTNQGAVQAVIGGTPTTLLTGGLNAASIAALTGAGLTGLSGAAFTVANLAFTPTTLALNNASANGPAVQLQGRLALPYGLTLDVTDSNRVVLDATGTTLSGVTTAVPSSSFSLGGVTFSGLSMGAAYNAAADRFVLTGSGTATVTTPNGNVVLTLAFGQGTTPGIAFTGGSLTTLSATVTGGFAVRGVSFAAQSLNFSYATASSTFALAGTATATAAGLGTLSVTFGHGTTPGLVVTNGALTSLDTTVGSTFAVNGVTFTTQDLDFSYSAAADRFGLAGTATAAVTKLGNLGVTFGYGSNPGLVITNGSLTSLDMTLTSDVTLSGVTITTKGLEFGYTAANNRYSLAGSATAAVAKLGTLGVTFGYGANPGLVVTNGTLTSLDMTLTTDVTVGGVGITTKGLEFGYTAANSQYTLAGSATASVAKFGTLGVTFGYGTNPGLVVTNGSLSSLDMTLTSDVTVAGVGITTKGLRFGYTAATSQYTLAGSATASVAKFGTLGVTFGYGSTPGLVVTNGTLTSLDMTLTSDVTVAGVGITTKGLEFGYTAANNQYTLAGSATANVAKLGTLGVTLGYGTNPGLVVTNGSLTSLGMTLTTDITVAGVAITTKGLRFGYTAASSQYTLAGSATAAVAKLGSLGVTFGYGSNPGLVVTNGSLTSLDMTLTTDINVAGVAITTKGLRFGYTAASIQYTLAGTATASVAKFGNLAITFGYGSNPGLVVTNGSLTSLDVTLNTDVSLGGVAITTKGLRFGYTAANSQYTLAGTATASVAKLGTLGVTFGYGNNPGLVVTNGSLTSLDLTLNTDVTVAGVAITTKGLRFGYTAANSQYTLAGTATATVAKLGSLGVTFGYGTNPGLVVTNGSLTSLDMTLNSDITVGGVRITTNGLRFGYTAANSQYTLAGTASASIAKLGNLGITFGNGTNPGLVVTNGALDRLDMTLNSDITVSSVNIATKGLRFTYTAANSQYTLTGTASVSVVRLGNLAVTFGYGDQPGLVITNGSLDRLDMTLNSNIRVGSLTFSTSGLRFTYTAANSQYTLTGTASVSVARLGSLSVTFGYGGKPGLVITNGSLDSLDLTLNSQIRVQTLVFRTEGLRFTYTAATDTFTLAGTAGVTILGIGDVAVTFGYGGKPGLVISNGSLDSLDLTLNSKIRVQSLIFRTEGLRFTYTAATDTFTLAGTAGVMILGIGDVSVTFGYGAKPGLVIANGSLVSLDLTLNTDIRVNAVVFSTKNLNFSYTTATKQFTLAGQAGVGLVGVGGLVVTFGNGGKPGLVITDGSLTSLDMTVGSDFNVGAVKFSGTGLRFQYSAANSTFTLTGSAGVTVAGMNAITVTFGKGSTPGIQVTDGKLIGLDMTVTSDVKVAGFTLSVKDLEFAYTASTGTFTIRGSASLSLGFQTFVVQLGNGAGSQGIVIKDGSVTNLDGMVSDTFGVAGLSFGKVSLHLVYSKANGTFDLDGNADLTLTASLPGFFSKFLSLKSLSTHLGTINVTVHSVAGNNGASYTSFSASLAGYSVGVKVSFSGDVTVTGVSDAIVQGIVDAAAKAAAAAAAAAKAVADAAAEAARKVANAASSAAHTVAHAFSSFFDNEIAGGTVFYDANSNGVRDAGELSTTTAADGTYLLDVPADAPGQLVGFGGVNVATNLPNTTVFTAPADSLVLSPLTSAVQAVRAAFPGLTAGEAAATVATALGIPDSVDLLKDDLIRQALSGNANAARAFNAAAEIAGLVGGVHALVGGSEAAASAAAFGNLAAQIGNSAGPLDLTDAAVVQQLIQATADQTGATLDPAVVAGAATVLAGINQHIESMPALGGRDYMTRVVQSQIVAGTAAVPMLVAAAAGAADINAVVAAQTGAAFAAQTAGVHVGALAAPVSNLSPTYAVAAGVGGAPRVAVYDRQTGTQMANFFSFEESFRGGSSAAVGDVNGDGVADVVVAAGFGGAARVIVIDGTKLDEVTAAGKITPDAVLANFYAFEDSFRGGASVALAQLGTGPGLDIVVGAGTGGGPRVRTFAFDPTAANGVTQLGGPIGDFFAFDPTARFGVNVAAGDLDGIGRDNVIVGAGVGGSPMVAVYLPDGTLQRQFMAYDPDLRGGVSVAAGYLNGTPHAQLVTGSGPGGPAVVNVYDGFNDTPERTTAVFDADYTGGVWVASGSAGDHSDIVYGAANGGSRVGTIGTDGVPAEADSSRFESTFLGGVSVG